MPDPRLPRAVPHVLLPTLQLHGQLQELALPLDAGGSVALPVLACASLERDAGGERVRLVLSPMRERLRVEAELARARRAADAAPGMLFEHALDERGQGSFGYVSAGLLTLYGLRLASHVADEAVWSRVHPEDLPALLQAREESARGRGAWAVRYRARASADEDWRWHDLQALPEAGPGGAIVWHGTIADVTRQRQMEQAERMRDAAQQANRAKSEFLARMSHELRTPLNGIIGFAQLMQFDRQHPPHPEQRRRLQIIAASGQHLLALINEVLDISRIESGHLAMDLSPVDLLPLLRQCLAAIEPMSAAAGVTVSLHGPPGCAVVADPLRLEQVVNNLLSNAVKYNRPQGLVRVEVAAQGGAWEIRVSDTGAGLTPEQQAQLFQPFNRLGAEQRPVEGSGLGLVITKHLVLAMGGRLEVSSRPGHGSVFSVALTAAVDAASAPAHPAGDDAAGPATSRAAALPNPRAAPAGRPRRRVLYVEDNPVNALVLSELLAEDGSLDVRVEACGEDALRVGDMDGATLLARARRLPGLGRVPAVAVSADALPEHIARARGLGFQDYWTKPLDVPRLLDDVLRMLDRGSEPSGPVLRRGP